MNWNEIGTQIIVGIVGVIISGLGIFITYLINKYIKNDEVKKIMNSLQELVKNAVLDVQQTFVDELKKANKFDLEAQKQAVERCLEVIKVNLPIEIKKWLEANYEDFEKYLRTLIEAQVKLLKIGG